MPIPKLATGGISTLYGTHAMFLASRQSRFSGRIEFVQLYCFKDSTYHDFPDEEAAHEFAKTYVPVPKHETN
jgi:hypothetical protein